MSIPEIVEIYPYIYRHALGHWSDSIWYLTALISASQWGYQSAESEALIVE